MAKVAHDFEIESHGVLKGVIGAVDGWLVKICQPTKLQDKVNKLKCPVDKIVIIAFENN